MVRAILNIIVIIRSLGLVVILLSEAPIILFTYHLSAFVLWEEGG